MLLNITTKIPARGEIYVSVYDIPQNMDVNDMEYIIVGGEKEYRVCAITDDYPESFNPMFAFGGNALSSSS